MPKNKDKQKIKEKKSPIKKVASSSLQNRSDKGEQSKPIKHIIKTKNLNDKKPWKGGRSQEEKKISEQINNSTQLDGNTQGHAFNQTIRSGLDNNNNTTFNNKVGSNSINSPRN